MESKSPSVLQFLKFKIKIGPRLRNLNILAFKKAVFIQKIDCTLID